MKNNYQSKIYVAIIFAGVFLAFVPWCYSQDQGVIQADYLVASANAPADQMSISYDGLSENSIDNREVESLETFAILVNEESSHSAMVSDKDDLHWIREKVAGLSKNFLKYFSVEDGFDSKVSAFLNLKSKIVTDTTRPEDFDVNVSSLIAGDDTSVAAISAVKISSYWASNYLDAVYDYENDGLELFFSNTDINAFLLEGMKLEFQISPEKSAGAFLLTMPF